MYVNFDFGFSSICRFCFFKCRQVYLQPTYSYAYVIYIQPFPPAAAAANANVMAGWMANAAASSSVQAAVVTASTLPILPNQGRL